MHATLHCGSVTNSIESNLDSSDLSAKGAALIELFGDFLFSPNLLLNN